MNAFTSYTNGKASFTNRYNKDGILISQTDHRKGYSLTYTVHKDLGNNKLVLKYSNGKYLLFTKGSLDYDYICDENGNKIEE